MKFLLLSIGLVFYIAGLFLFIKELIKNGEQYKKSSRLLLVGIFLILANCFYLWYSVDKQSIFLIITFAIIFIGTAFLFYKDDISKWAISSFIIIGLILWLTYGGKLAPVTLDNGVIKMEGSFGRFFYVSDILSIDTISIAPKTVGTREGGGTLTTALGNYHLENESKMAKFRIYKNNPPYIKIRMNDNSLFILNFKEPEKTVEFYNQIIDAINSH